jgi:hypothetical protein
LSQTKIRSLGPSKIRRRSKAHEGQHVQVKAHVYADKGSIHIMEVKMLKGGATKKEEMKK